MGVLTPTHPEDFDVPDATFASPDVTTFCRVDELGLGGGGRATLGAAAGGARLSGRRAGSVVSTVRLRGRGRDTVVRRLAHEPLGWRPTVLEVTIRRYRCTGCGHVWRQDTTRAAEPRARLSRRALRWALEGLVVQHLTVARIAEVSRIVPGWMRPSVRSAPAGSITPVSPTCIWTPPICMCAPNRLWWCPKRSWLPISLRKHPDLPHAARSTVPMRALRRSTAEPTERVGLPFPWWNPRGQHVWGVGRPWVPRLHAVTVRTSLSETGDYRPGPIRIGLTDSANTGDPWS